MKDTFRYFIRKNFPEIGSELSNKDIDKIGVEFHKHLDSKLNDEQKKRILPKNTMDVIMKSEHPFKPNGFEPAYVLHFTQWVKEQWEAQSEYLAQRP